MRDPMNVAVLGAGGLGKAAARILRMKQEMRLVGICDSVGFAYREEGLDGDEVAQVKIGGSVAHLPEVGHHSEDALGELLNRKGSIDGVLIALPNLPNNFIPGVVRRFTEAGFCGCFVDALKRTAAMEMMFELDENLKGCHSAYITGCGATPGLLTAAAVLGAQSFVKVEKVDIWWGVGIANWDEYKATIREDIAHLPGYDVDKTKAMTDQEVESLLDKTNGLLELHEMEHADDLLLQRVGVVEQASQVEVGGVMDTRHARKPVSTTMTLTGITFDGKRSSHRFVLGDETTMAANVIGPALGYLKRAAWLRERGIYGMFGSTEMMPCVVK
ncbi:MAG: saccharopine dehydrogenase-like oxidoreductase [Armatimonadetes bacterium]|nr:saccharopine dehydrogenase-like oxidoreductase [Armatimonadota bacterium]